MRILLAFMYTMHMHRCLLNLSTLQRITAARSVCNILYQIYFAKYSLTAHIERIYIIFYLKQHLQYIKSTYINTNCRYTTQKTTQI